MIFTSLERSCHFFPQDSVSEILREASQHKLKYLSPYYDLIGQKLVGNFLF